MQRPLSSPTGVALKAAQCPRKEGKGRRGDIFREQQLPSPVWCCEVGSKSQRRGEGGAGATSVQVAADGGGAPGRIAVYMGKSALAWLGWLSCLERCPGTKGLWV